ncbi:hypothetical protein IWX92DRAFT_361459 [Phyllosticta citricarpa]
MRRDCVLALLLTATCVDQASSPVDRQNEDGNSLSPSQISIAQTDHSFLCPIFFGMVFPMRMEEGGRLAERPLADGTSIRHGDRK